MPANHATYSPNSSIAAFSMQATTNGPCGYNVSSRVSHTPFVNQYVPAGPHVTSHLRRAACHCGVRNMVNNVAYAAQPMGSSWPDSNRVCISERSRV